MVKSYISEVAGKQTKVELTGMGRAAIDGHPVAYSHHWLTKDSGDIVLIVDGRSFDLAVEKENGRLRVAHLGHWYEISIEDERFAKTRRKLPTGDRPSGCHAVKSPMPGMVLKILVSDGQHVEKGDRLVVLEAMKMENDVKALYSGRVSSISVAPGQKVSGGQELATIE